MRRHLVASVLLTVCIAGHTSQRHAGWLEADDAFVVRRDTLTTSVTGSGAVKPVRSRTYRPPVLGREQEITYLSAEGTRVEPGAILVQLDSTELLREANRLEQELRTLQTDLTSAHSARQDAESSLHMLAEGEGVVARDEVRARLRLAELAQTRARQKQDEMQRLLAKGFVTIDEAHRVASDLEQAELEVSAARKRVDVVENLTHPRERRRAEVQLAQTNSKIEDLIGRVEEAERRLQDARLLVRQCTIRAEVSGVVVHEPYLFASVPRKIRVGDRVGHTQPLVSLPTHSQMAVEATVHETDVDAVTVGQPAAIRVEAFPGLRLTGKVSSVASVPDIAIVNGFEQRRFKVLVVLDTTPTELRPEMTAAVSIVTRRIENALLVPVESVFRHRDSYATRVQDPAGVGLRAVQPGASNDQFVEILNGLKEGERVVR